jgi:hypothetical protein
VGFLSQLFKPLTRMVQEPPQDSPHACRGSRGSISATGEVIRGVKKLNPALASPGKIWTPHNYNTWNGCVNDRGHSGYVLQVSQASQLDSVFSSIAQKLANLRISE